MRGGRPARSRRRVLHPVLPPALARPPRPGGARRRGERAGGPRRDMAGHGAAGAVARRMARAGGPLRRGSRPEGGPMNTFARAEVEEALAIWWQVGNVRESWSAWTELFVPDVEYHDYFWGPLHGRAEVDVWINAVMKG